MADIKVLKHYNAEDLVVADFNNPVTKLCKWMNTVPIFRPYLSKLDVQYPILPKITHSGFTAPKGTSTNTPDLRDIVLSLSTTKPSAFLKVVELLLVAFLGSSPSKTLLTHISDSEYVDLHMKAFPFMDIEVHDTENIVVENLSYSYMDESNYIQGENPGDFFVHYRITKLRRLVLYKIIEITKDENDDVKSNKDRIVRRMTVCKNHPQWEDVKFRSMIKFMTNHWIFYHAYIHMQNGAILNQINTNVKNIDILHLINAFSEDIEITNTLVSNGFFGNVTNSLFGNKDAYANHLNINMLQKIDIVKNKGNVELNKRISGYHIYKIIKRYRVTIGKFVRSYFSKSHWNDIRSGHLIVQYLKENKLIHPNETSLQDIVELYILNIIIHSFQHVQIYIHLRLIGYVKLQIEQNDKLSSPIFGNFAYLNFIPLIHDNFAYNLDFWLDDKKYSQIIQTFRRDLEKTDDFVRKCNLHDLFGIQNITSAINE